MDLIHYICSIYYLKSVRILVANGECVSGLWLWPYLVRPDTEMPRLHAE